MLHSTHDFAEMFSNYHVLTLCGLMKPYNVRIGETEVGVSFQQVPQGFLAIQTGSHCFGISQSIT